MIYPFSVFTLLTRYDTKYSEESVIKIIPRHKRRHIIIFPLLLLLILSGIAIPTLVINALPQSQSLPSHSFQMTSSAPYISWNVTWGRAGAHSDWGRGMVIDARGDLYCVGGTYSFGAGGADLALVKFFPNGTRAWNVTWGGAHTDGGDGVAIDAGGSLYCVGWTTSFGAGLSDFVLVKFFSNGTRAWNVTWGGASTEGGRRVAVDAGGNLYCVGDTSSFGAGEEDLALVKFFSNGTRGWNVTWGGADIDRGEDVAIDVDGNLYCVGRTVSFGAGSFALALVKFFPNGTRAWNITWGGTQGDGGDGVAIDTGGNLYCVGSTSSFGAGREDLALVKFFPNGTRIWNCTWGGTQNEYSTDVDLDASGNLYCVGVTESFGEGMEDLALVKFFPNGTRAWNVTWGGVDSDIGRDGGIDAGGNLYCVGTTSSFPTPYGSDLALVKFGFELDILNPIMPNPNEDGKIELIWSEVVGATTYYIYRERSSITSLVGLTPKYTTSERNYTDTLITNGLYYYAIVGGNSTWNSSRSNCQSVTVVIPLTPSVLEVIAPNPDEDGIISLNWSKVMGATRYYIYREISNITSVIGLTPKYIVSANSFTDTLPTNGVYYYAIVAGDAFVNSSRSNCRSVTVAIPEEIPGFNLVLLLIGILAIFSILRREALPLKQRSGLIHLLRLNLNDSSCYFRKLRKSNRSFRM